MIEIIVMDYLKNKLSVPVKIEEEEELPEEYILIEKTGSKKNNHIKSAVITIKSYASSLYRAAKLNEEVKEAMEQIIEMDDVSRCELNTDYNFTDTSRKKYRYQAVFDIVYY